MHQDRCSCSLCQSPIVVSFRRWGRRVGAYRSAKGAPPRRAPFARQSRRLYAVEHLAGSARAPSFTPTWMDSGGAREAPTSSRVGSTARYLEPDRERDDEFGVAGGRLDLDQEWADG